MIGNFNNKKRIKTLVPQGFKSLGGGYKPYKINDLAECADAQFSASFERAQDSARQPGSGAEHTSQTAKEFLKEGNNNKINCNIHRASGRETTHKCFVHPASLQPIPRKRCAALPQKQ